MSFLEINIEQNEMPADGTKCYTCGKVIEGKMFQYFMFAGDDLEPTATKFKLCETCYNE